MGFPFWTIEMRGFVSILPIAWEINLQFFFTPGIWCEIWQKISNHPGNFTSIWGQNNANMEMHLLQLRHLFAKVLRNKDTQRVKRILVGNGFTHVIPRLVDINHPPDFVFLAYFVKVTELWITIKSIANKPVF